MQAIKLGKKYSEFKQDEIFDLINKFTADGKQVPGLMIWSNFFQFSYNCYSEDAEKCGFYRRHPELSYKPYLRWDDRLWDDLVTQMVQAGVNQ